LPEGLDQPEARRVLTAESELFGSVSLSPDGSRAVLFTTTGSGRVSVVGPDRTARSLDLISSVRAVIVTPDASHAIALQDPAPGSMRRGAFSVLSLSSVRSPKLVAADAPAESIALSVDMPERAVVTVSDPARAVYGTFLVRMPNLQVDESSLASRPLATGVVPSAGKAFVAQDHPEGRITFIQLEDGTEREITGFELSAKVVSE
jgi:hypothetical protein